MCRCVQGATLPYDSAEAVAARLEAVSPTFAPRFRNALQSGTMWLNGEYSKTLSGTVSADPLVTPIAQFYQTDAISRASQTMARAVIARQSADAMSA